MKIVQALKNSLNYHYPLLKKNQVNIFFISIYISKNKKIIKINFEKAEKNINKKE